MNNKIVFLQNLTHSIVYFETDLTLIKNLELFLTIKQFYDSVINDMKLNISCISSDFYRELSLN